MHQKHPPVCLTVAEPAPPIAETSGASVRAVTPASSRGESVRWSLLVHPVLRSSRHRPSNPSTISWPSNVHSPAESGPVASSVCVEQRRRASCHSPRREALPRLAQVPLTDSPVLAATSAGVPTPVSDHYKAVAAPSLPSLKRRRGCGPGLLFSSSPWLAGGTTLSSSPLRVGNRHLIHVNLPLGRLGDKVAQPWIHIIVRSPRGRKVLGSGPFRSPCHAMSMDDALDAPRDLLEGHQARQAPLVHSMTKKRQLTVSLLHWS